MFPCTKCVLCEGFFLVCDGGRHKGTIVTGHAKRVKTKSKDHSLFLPLSHLSTNHVRGKIFVYVYAELKVIFTLICSYTTAAIGPKRDSADI